MPKYRLIKGSIQEGFQNCRAKIQVFAGSYGNGKSTGMIIKALKLAMLYPGSLGLMARATYPKLNDTLRRDLLRWCPKNWIKRRPTKDDNSLYLINGSTTHFRYIAQRGKSTEDGSTTSNLLSASYDWIVVDQIEDPEIQYKDFLDLIGRLRGSTPFRETDGMADAEILSYPESGPRWFMIGCNPTRNWFYREIVAPYHMWKERGIFSDKLLVDEDTRQPIIEIFESDVYANAHNLKPDYIRGLEIAYKGQMYDRYVLGKWAAYEGLVHPEFDALKHTLSRQNIMDYLGECRERHVHVRALEGYDFGNTAPSVYMLAFVDDMGRVVIVDGFYKPNFNYDQHPQAIAEIRLKYIQYLDFDDPIIADPAIFRKSVVAKRETGTSIATLLREMDVDVRPGHSDVTSGIAKVNAYLADKVGARHLLTDEPSGPMLYVADDLSWFENEITNYYWKKNPFGEQIDEPQEHNDHAMNTVKYMLSHLPEPSQIIIPSNVLPKEWMFWREMEPEEYRAAINNRYGNY
jgi:hypothetical protein